MAERILFSPRMLRIEVAFLLPSPRLQSTTTVGVSFVFIPRVLWHEAKRGTRACTSLCNSIMRIVVHRMVKVALPAGVSFLYTLFAHFYALNSGVCTFSLVGSFYCMCFIELNDSNCSEETRIRRVEGKNPFTCSKR